jgi:hypothetical protein
MKILKGFNIILEIYLQNKMSQLRNLLREDFDNFDIQTDGDSETSPDQRLMNQYNRCIFALVAVLTKRMKIFYRCDFEEPHDRIATELRFSNILAKILTKMKSIEQHLGK